MKPGKGTVSTLANAVLDFGTSKYSDRWMGGIVRDPAIGTVADMEFLLLRYREVRRLARRLAKAAIRKVREEAKRPPF
jgi:hypothetical protein